MNRNKSIGLENAEIKKGKQNNEFSIYTRAHLQSNSRTYHFRSKSSTERDAWIHAITLQQQEATTRITKQHYTIQKWNWEQSSFGSWFLTKGRDQNIQDTQSSFSLILNEDKLTSSQAQVPKILSWGEKITQTQTWSAGLLNLVNSPLNFMSSTRTKSRRFHPTINRCR